MIKKLRKRFIRIAMISIASVMMLLCLTVNIANFISVDSELTDMLNLISNNQGKIPPMHREHRPVEDRGGQFTQETPYTTRYFALFYSDDGTLARADLENIAAVTEDDTQKYLDIALKHGEGYGYTRGYKYLVVNNGENRRMAIFLDSHNEMHNIATIIVLSLIAAVFCTVIVYVIVVLFSRKAIDPVVKASEKQKQFITDASHELKTPITVIATCLKVLEMDTGKCKWINKAQFQIEKLTQLVNSIVTLSRMDEDNSPLKFERFSISDSIRETAESFSDFSASNGHSLQISVEPGLSYYGDEYAVRQLVSILLDNAIKYASSGTPVLFALEKSKHGVTVRTSNECDTVDISEFDKLFDRFYRPDKSRSSTTGGFGIGLSIAKSIAEGHKGSIHAESKDGKSVEFIAELK